MKIFLVISTALNLLLFPQYATAEDSLYVLANTLFGQMPKHMPDSEHDTEKRIQLGRALYFDTHFSANNTQSSNSCHNLTDTKTGTENRSVSVGAKGLAGRRNSPTTWNAGFQFVQFWDGRSPDLVSQAGNPLLNPIEMALASKDELVEKLTEAGYQDLFDAAFPKHDESLTFENTLEALAAFQRTLITRDRFDQYLAGDLDAINAQEKRGLKSFITVGCNACHNGPLLGGELFMKMGLVNPYPNKQDKGRAEITGNPADNFLFKVPTHRNVAKTAPYFHDGAVFSLEQAVQDTAWHQLGVTLKPEEVEDITAFFHTFNNTRNINGVNVNGL
ncbi:cytochrome-c peroxidase [Veronia nyctiphanis]|uniref:Cytochrome-c peroxidase n=1 Tax=Veronia nyctiphanis TaxID=1278244 RepID=A0A4Q0YZ16_9GAMM|nr:cytochrome c peroxidase [Veronia nyctiphanis]RXJ74459.1 cytochrome-c peroxidase [Veronia nyctiphanis]